MAINKCMLSEFSVWLKNRQVSEGVFGNWNYTIPESKKELMYDFYMLEYLLPHGVHLYMRPLDFGPEETPSGYDPEGKAYGDTARTSEDKFYYALYETANKLLPYLKKELSNALMFAIAAELRHVSRDDFEGLSHSESRRERVNSLFDEVGQKFGKSYEEMFRRFALNYTHYYNQSPLKDILPKVHMRSLYGKHPEEEAAGHNYEAYRNSYKAMKQAGGTNEEWAKLASWLFKQDGKEEEEYNPISYLSALAGHPVQKTKKNLWESSFGGKSWGMIADAWLHLNQADTPTKLISYIDHVFDLQHNTGSVFTKLAKYLKDGGYQWIEDALNHKRDVVSPHELIEHVSAPMRDLGLIGIKAKTGKTWGDFEKEWPEIVKQKTDAYNRHELLKYEKEKREYEEKHPGSNFYGSRPKPLSVDEYERSHLRDSGSPFSTGKLTKHYKSGENFRFQHIIGHGTQDVPQNISDYKPGDEVSLQWPPRHWFKVSGVVNSGGKEYLDTDYGTMDLSSVKGYKSKDVPEKFKAETPAKPGVYYKDYFDNPIKVGDTVKKFVSSSGKVGTVLALSPTESKATVRWNTGQEKDYMTNLLVVQETPKAAEPPKVEPPKAPSLHAIDGYGNQIKVGDKITFKHSPSIKGKILAIDHHPSVSSAHVEYVSGGEKIQQWVYANQLKLIPDEIKDKNGKVIKLGDKIKHGGLNGEVTHIDSTTDMVSYKIVIGGKDAALPIQNKPANEVEVVGSTEKTAKDYHGDELKVGDEVALTSSHKTKGKITKIEDDGWVYFDNGSSTHNLKADTLTKVKEVKDKNGNVIKIGDYVKSAMFAGKVTDIATVHLGTGETGYAVYFDTNDGNKKRYSNELEIIPELSKEVKDYKGKVIKVGDYVKTTILGNHTGKVTKIAHDATYGMQVFFTTSDGKEHRRDPFNVEVVPEPAKEAKDKNGKVIKVGDYVRSIMMKDVAGTVTEIKDDPYLGIIVNFTRADGKAKWKDVPGILEVVPEPKKEVKDKNGYTLKIGDPVVYFSDSSHKGIIQDIQSDNIVVKWSKNGVISSIAPSKVILAGPEAAQPKQSTGQATGVKAIWEELKGTPQSLRLARVIRAAKPKGETPTTFLVNSLATLGIPVNNNEIQQVIKIYWEEVASEKYYKAHATDLYPTNITPQIASDVLAQRFPNPPHVYIDHNTTLLIEQALNVHNNDAARALVEKTTKFAPGAAKGLTVYLKLEMYMSHGF